MALAATALAACAAAQLASLPAASAARQPPPRPPASGTGEALLAWGSNSRGQLGNGSRDDTASPGSVHLPATFIPTAAAGGASFGVAAGDNHTIYAWGDNLHGQLGNGRFSTGPAREPSRVLWPAAVTPVVITAGGSSAYVIGGDGALYDWGSNKSGQLGIGSTHSSAVPVKVRLPGGATPVAVAGGENSAYAVGSDGSVYSWGANSSGQLGNHSVLSSTTPVRVQLPGGVKATAVAAGQAMAYALTAGGAVYSWGDDARGQLGTTQASLRSLVPVQVQLPGTVTAAAISAGGTTGYAVGSDGLAYAWGDNSLGQLGHGPGDLSRTPAQVLLPGSFRPAQITGGLVSAYAASTAGQVYGWGANSLGQLGTTPLTRSSPPVLTGIPVGVTAAALVPEPMSQSGYALTGRAGLRTRDYTKTARVTYLVGGPGPTVHLLGGGGGPDHSNCTTEETSTTGQAFADPTHTAVSFRARDDGACSRQPSYSYIRCSLPLVHMTCDDSNPSSITLNAFPG